MKNLKYLFISFIVFFIDQISKFYVRYYFAKEKIDSISVIGDFFRLTWVQNKKAAFSLGFSNVEHNIIFFPLIGILVIAFVVYLLFKEKLKLAIIAYSLIIGGALGNIFDRVYLGSVTDFLDFDFPDFIFYRWPTFNLADSSIVIAMGLLILSTIKLYPNIKNGKVLKNEE